LAVLWSNTTTTGLLRNKRHDSKEHLKMSNAGSAIMMAGAPLAKFAMAVRHFGA